jgi:peptidoglycan/LPS O-acetylase OafA/YrhL
MQLPRHMEQLDVLRGIAVLIVMIYHSCGNVPSLHLVSVFRYGWTGVDLFFVLSGFLITGILLQTKNTPGYFLNFYARRALRIWPLYLGILTFGFIVVPLVQPQLRALVFEQCHPWQSYLFFVQNILVPESGKFGPLQITWSLCVEEQFYLVWPVIVLACSITNVRRIAIGALLLSLGLRFAEAHQWLTIDTYHNTLCRFDGLALGSFAATILQEWETKLVQQYSLWLGTLAAACIAATTPFGIAKWTFLTLISLLFCAVMCFSISTPAFPKPGFLSYTGRISYGLYLLHVPAFDIVRDRHIRWLVMPTHNTLLNDVSLFVCSLALAYGLAIISWKVLESPALSFKRYFTPRQKAVFSERNDCIVNVATPTA